MQTDKDKLYFLRAELYLISNEFGLYNYLNEFAKKVFEGIRAELETAN